MICIYIYVDVLIVLNIYITYFLLLATAKTSHTPIKSKRCILASVVGGFFSLLILIPSLNYFVNLAFKLIASVLIILVSFGIRNGIKYVARLTMWFYAMNFIFAGIMLSLRYAFSLSFVRFSNSYFYMDFSILSLVIFTVLSYSVICIVRYIIDKSVVSNGVYKVIIKHNKKIIAIEGIADTGNALVDSFSGRPVIVCGKAELRDIINIPDFAGVSNDYSDYLQMGKSMRGFKLIPYSTIGENGIIPVFIPDEIIIKEEKTNKIKYTDALIGVSNRDIKAIFNPKILS